MKLGTKKEMEFVLLQAKRIAGKLAQLIGGALLLSAMICFLALARGFR